MYLGSLYASMRLAMSYYGLLRLILVSYVSSRLDTPHSRLDTPHSRLDTPHSGWILLIPG